MALSTRSGKVQTVLGLLEPASLGVTLTHEHLYMDFIRASYTAPQEKHAAKVSMDITLENLGWIRQNPYSNKPNMMLHGIDEAILCEMMEFKKNGGCSIVENSTNGLDRDIRFVRDLAEKTGVNIIAGTGYYVDTTHPSDMGSKTEESLCQEMIHDITDGIGDTGIKCGAIGEIGCCWPLTANERKSLRASAAAQVATGAPVIIHPGRCRKAPEEILRVLAEAGGDVTKTVMSHLDRTLHTDADLLDFAQLGAYCEYDLFGVEVSHYQYPSPDVIDMPSDAERIRRVRYLIENGFQQKVLIAHDIHTKHRLTKYGGHGYSHILENVVPKMRERGISQSAIDEILVDNPRRWLTFK